MFQEGGILYVYLCYGIHHLVNIVTNKKHIPHAVLIRSLKPLDGIQCMKKRRNINDEKMLCNGPALLSNAMKINLSHNQTSLLYDKVWIEHKNIIIDQDNIIASPRVGIPYAGKDISNPWRFRIKNNVFLYTVK